MEPKDVSRLSVGMIVAVAETDAESLEKLHLYNNVNCPKRLPHLIGRVGLVIDIGEDTVKVRFYSYGFKNENERGNRHAKAQLSSLDAVLIERALNPCIGLRFLSGDHAALVNANDKSDVKLVSLQEDRDRTLLVSGQGISTFRYEDRSLQYLLPIYTGKTFNQLMRDRATNNNEDSSPGRLLYGPLQEDDAALVEAVREYSITGHHQNFMRVTAKYANQINNVVQDRTPLQLATELGNWPACVSLIAMGSDRNRIDSQQNTLLHLAAKGGFVSTLEGFLLFIPQELNHRNIDGDTALHFAAKRCHAACVDRLLSVENIQPNIQNRRGDTPLHVVAALPEHENKQVVLGRMLTCAHVAPHIANSEDLTPLQVAISKGFHVATTEFLLARPGLLNVEENMGSRFQFGVASSGYSLAQLSPLHTAALFGRHRVLEAVMERGADINSLSRNGRTPLHFCVERWDASAEVLERLASIQLLVTSGCSINCRDIEGMTPLHLAILQLNRSPQPPDDKLRAIRGSTSTVKLDELAAQVRPYWSLAVAAYLCLNGGDLTIRSTSGNSAASMCHYKAVRELLIDLASFRVRACLPRSLLDVSAFDPSEVAICTFSCADNAANVIFNPCKHRVICSDCISSTRLRRCPLCSVRIDVALADGKSIYFKPTTPDETPANERIALGIPTNLSMNDVQRIAAEAAKIAKQEAKEESKRQLQDLRAKLDELEIATQCAICFDQRNDVVFGCGHTACRECASNLENCHICRKLIMKRQTMFA